MDQQQGIGVMGFVRRGSVLKLDTVHGVFADILECKEVKLCGPCTPKRVEREIAEHGRFHCPLLHDVLLAKQQKAEVEQQPPSSPLKAWLDKWGVNPRTS